MKVGGKLRVLICLLAICWPGGDFALAQEPEEKPETEESQKPTEGQRAEEEPAEPPKAPTEKITVTATRVETELMKTPVAVSVFDQETLDREGVQNIRDMAEIKQRDNLPVTIGLQMVLMPEYEDQILPLARLGKELRPDYLVIKHCSDNEDGDLGVDYGAYQRLYDKLREAEIGRAHV